jgi:GTP cyclohydrolase II
MNQPKAHRAHTGNPKEAELLHLVEFYSSTLLPTEFGEFNVSVFRERKTGKEHLAIVKGEIQGVSNLLIRMHSECLTGEVLHSLKCDCKDQLHAALERIAQEQQGMVIYLRQEGRGIGLGNKIRAYALQERGYDTVDANRALGFGDDLRTYDVAAAILRYFEIDSVSLLTNNPLKLDSLGKFGIHVQGRIPLLCPPNQHSRQYFESKSARMGHLFDRSFLAPSQSDTAEQDESSETLPHPSSSTPRLSS